MRALASAVLLGAVVCLIVVCLMPVTASATVYKWVDENGVAHYTLDRDEVPRRFRERLRPAGALTQPLPALPPAPAPAEDAKVEEMPASLVAPEEPVATPVDTALAVEQPAPVSGSEETPVPDGEPATPHAPSASPAPGVDAALSLEQQIARDREAIKQLISSDKATGIDVANDPALREIAERLPRLQSEYEELQREPSE